MKPDGARNDSSSRQTFQSAEFNRYDPAPLGNVISLVSEATVESAGIAWLEEEAWAVAHGPDIAPDMPSAERGDHGAVVLRRRLRAAPAALNPDLPRESRGEHLRLCYFQKRGLQPIARKRVSPEIVAAALRRLRSRQLRELMTTLFESGLLDGFKMRRVYSCQ